MPLKTHSVPVWDILVRIFHWSLVLAFLTAYLTGDEYENIHAYAGYIVTGLIIFRVVWGFIGTRHARFRNFVTKPSAVFGHLKQMLAGQPDHYLGHNPAAGAMVVALLLTLSLTVFSGLKTYGAQGYGPLANSPEIGLVSLAIADDENDDEESEHDDHDNESEEYWEEIHEVSVNLTLLLIVLHVGGVLVSSHLERQNLTRAMITGNKIVAQRTESEREENKGRSD